MDRPADDELRHGLSRVGGDQPQLVEQILIPLPLLALKPGVFGPAVTGLKDVVPRELACQKPLHKRPVNADGNSSLTAPGQGITLDIALQHVVRRLKGRDRASGMELFEL